MTPTTSVNDPPGVFRPLDLPLPTPSGRPSWSGLLQLNLVGIPLKAYPAVRQREAPAFHQLHADCGQRIRCPKHCPVHGPVDSAALVRAYEYGPGQHVILEADEVDQLRPAHDRALRLEHFLTPGECDPLLYAGRSFYLHPDGPAALHGYAVVHAVMVQRGRWALGQMVLGGQRQVVLMRPTTGVLVLHVLHYPELVRACSAPGASPRPTTPDELQLAGQLVDAASEAVSWSVYRDETAAELRALVEAKLQGQGIESPASAPQILPFLEALHQSVATLRPPKAEEPPANEAPAPRPRKRRRA
jgi:DNA end-binding protein Ku